MILTVNIPKRGQKLTNGDVIMALFPKTKVREKFTDGKNDGYEIDMHITDVSPHIENVFRFWCPSGWWNGIYKGGDIESEENKSCDNCKWNKTEKCQPSTCAMIGYDGHGLWDKAEVEPQERSDME